jgi:hypothetical protein
MTIGMLMLANLAFVRARTSFCVTKSRLKTVRKAFSS